jgi:2-polyprenyl-3-methyl-5-hydroxy-6-metoxy-1,4-benzoquinol methylase
VPAPRLSLGISTPILSGPSTRDASIGSHNKEHGGTIPRSWDNYRKYRVENLNISDAQSRSAYELWHSRLGIDEANDTPWHRLVRSYLPLDTLRGKSILEIGCGRGDFSCWLAQQLGGSARLIAADFSVAAVSMGREYSRSQGLSLDWQVMDIQNIGYADSSFDVIFSCETIEHVPDPTRAIHELARTLKPGGTLFLTTPNYMNVMGLYRGYMRIKGTPFTETGQPINNFVMLPLTLNWVRAAGLRVLRSDSRGIYFPIPRRPWTEANWLERPRWLSRWFGLHSFVMATKD